jgi:uncharacterized protein with HEPN domain
LVRSAIVQKLAVIGEAASRVSDELKGRHAEVLWPKVVAFRNILIHAYCGIDREIVWRAASEEIPVLRGQIARILDEFGNPDGSQPLT